MEPHFDGWTIFFTLAAIGGFVTAGRLLLQKQHCRAFQWLGSLVIMFAITLAEWVLWWTNYIEVFPCLKGISASFPMFFGVILLGYYRAAFDEKMPSINFWHFLPGIFYLVKISPLYFWSLGIKVYDWGKFTFLTPTLDAAMYFMYLHFTIYPVWIYRSYRSRFETDPEMLHWHRWILGAYCGIVFSFWLHHFLTLAGMMNPRLDFIIACFITIFMSFVGWLGIVQRRILAGETFKEAVFSRKYRKSALSLKTTETLANQILLLFEEEKIYLDPNLTLELLAKRLGVSRHHVSQVINANFSMGFSDWVAKCRVQEAQALLAFKPKNAMIIKEIAYSSGFNTKASFNLAFKKWTGFTPTEYREKLTEEEKEKN